MEQMIKTFGSMFFTAFTANNFQNKGDENIVGMAEASIQKELVLRSSRYRD
jgi:hypothetical protein